jgi:predicted alpha-1,2-mannosidase
MPMWPLHAKETFCMTGYHSADVIAEAITKKYPIDAKRAYSVIRKQAFESDRLGQGLYRKFKYIPADLEGESIGKGMDYAFNAWSAAHVAKAAGAPADDVTALFEQATYYRNFYDKGTQFVRPRLENGEWAEPFAPNEMGHMKKWRDYTESNAWQATFAVQHDPEGLAQLLGGRKQLEEKLDALFNADPALPADAPPDIAGIVGQYAHGNEPSHHIAYLYVYAGAPHKTQARVASLLETQYHNEPDGLAGNEDCGQMSAWYVMSAMGFYAVDPTSGNYVIGSPIFDKVTIDIGGGHTLRIDAKRKEANDQYVQSVALNGQQQQRLWFSHESIAQGGEIKLAMSSTPNTTLGSGQEDVPPSMSTGKTT